MKIKDVITCIENFAPISYQEEYDNSGLLISHNNEVRGILLSFEITEDVINEAASLNANLIISHHPIIYSGLRKITGKNYIERSIIKAIKNDIAIYVAHTNMDNIEDGVNKTICNKLGLINTKILSPKKNELVKLVTFVPKDYSEQVKEAIFEAGAGQIGNYDSCSFNITGEGTFRGNENTNPFVGDKGKIHSEEETRIEVILEKYKQKKVIQALLNAHPYEEVAYDIYPLGNIFSKVGSGMIGELSQPIDEISFFDLIKKAFHVKVIRHTKLLNKPIVKVAVCGGSGSFLLPKAIESGSNIFISADFKYHQFFDADNEIIIADIGHFESEQYILDIFYELLTKKISNFAIHLSKINTNPINYY